MTIITMNDLERARLLELAVDSAVVGLDPDETLELEQMTARHGVRLDDSFDQAAAALTMALPRKVSPLPEDLRRRIVAGADRYFSPMRDDASPSPVRGREREEVKSLTTKAFAKPSRPFGPVAVAGWALAAGLAAVLVFTLPRDGELETPRTAAVVAAPESEPASSAAPTVDRAQSLETRTPVAQTVQSARDGDPARDRASLIANERFLLRRAWSAGGDPTGIGVAGDVIWDEERQTGYMRFVGLRRNDPSFEQYQLWIFDGRRDQQFPVDGGVFDAIGRGNEIVVPIRAKLPVGTPLMFAVTIERPGGVVVSDRSRIVVVARVG